MRVRILLLVALLLALAVTPPAATAQVPAAAPRLRITELLAAPNATLGQREFIELLNDGVADVDLAGWRVQDAPTASNSTNKFTFATQVLGPGERIVVWSNGSADATGPSWSTSASKTVWNDAGDAATLLAPDGSVHDWLGYGTTTQAAPNGFNASKPAAPSRGQSLQLGNGTWSTAAPTPGLAPGQAGGHAVATVANVAPTIRLAGPASTRAGEPVTLHLDASDANGGADLVAWTVAAAGATLAHGNGTTDDDLQLTAPAAAGTWTLVATARDAAGANATATLAIVLRQARLAIDLPAGGALHFPDLRPGDRNVTSTDAFRLRNDGDEAATPLLDVSAFRAGAAAIPVDGNLWIGVSTAGRTTWHAYDAALTALPALAPGEQAAVTLRIGAVPVPAATGLYGTTFTVVAA